MKYRLKKDLPFAKAGEKIYNYVGNPFNNDNYDCFIKKPKDWIYPPVYLYENNQMVFIGDKRDLLQGGWIEGVKPREWAFGIDTDRIVAVLDERGATILGSAQTCYDNIIEVREVL